MQEAGWATAHMPVLGHDIGNSIVTQGLGGRAGHAARGPRHGQLGATIRPSARAIQSWVHATQRIAREVGVVS